MRTSSLLVTIVIAAALWAWPCQAQSPKGASGDVTLEVSRAWYLLQQVDCQGLLHGMPQRLTKVVDSTPRADEIWTGVEDGGQLDIEIIVEGEVEGDILVGFFADPAWSANPVQVRSFPKPGKYTVDRLKPGKFCLAAIIGKAPYTKAKGVYRQWPQLLDIAAGSKTEAQLRLSPKYQDFGHPDLDAGFAGVWGELDPARVIAVRAVTADGAPVPFSNVTLASRLRGDPNKIDEFFQLGTDIEGRAYCDKIREMFSVMVHRNDFLPESQIERWEFKRVPGLHDARERAEIVVPWGPFPNGSGMVSGRIHDQHGEPLPECYLYVTHEEGDRLGEGDFRSFGYKVPVIDAEGRYELGGLPPGEYKAKVRAFDYPTHDYRGSEQTFIIPVEEGAAVHQDVEVEAKELLYGRAVYEDGTPLDQGGWVARFEPRRKDDPWGGRHFSLGMAPDGNFRVTLSAKERQDLLETTGGQIQINDRSGAIGSVHIDDLAKANMRPIPTFTFPRKAAE